MRRAGRLSPEELRPILLDEPHPRAVPVAPSLSPLPEEFRPLDWPALFGNAHPVEVEVGFGKGAFLTASGPARTDVNFLGVELERKYVMLTAQRLIRRDIPNVRLACTDARWFFRNRVPPGSLAAVHVYFPDPWWKQKHHKRRVLTPEFLLQIVAALKPAGHFLFASDVQAYFDETVKIIAEQGQLQAIPVVASDVMTNFERKYHDEGRPIYRARYERLAKATEILR